MGLDVYLYKFNGDNLKEAFKAKGDHYEAVEEIKSKIWDESLNGREFDELSSEEHDERRRKQEDAVQTYIREHQLPLLSDGYGGLELDESEVEFPSKTDPDHMFKIGYIRSSYNDSGIDRLIEQRTGKSLADIFGLGDEYTFAPDWAKAKGELEFLLTVFDNDEGFRVMEEGPNPFSDPQTLPTSEKDALAIFTEENEREWSHDGGYSNIHGAFYPKGIEIQAIIPGTKEFMGRQIPTTYIIYRPEDGVKW
jgi:hypothetical protein